MSKTRNSLDGKIIRVRQGLAVYKVNASPYYRVRLWQPSLKKRLVKTTKATTRVDAIEAAEELYAQMGSRGSVVSTPKNKTFEHFADKLVDLEKAHGIAGRIYQRQYANTRNLLNSPLWGAVSYFKDRDIADIQTKHFNAYKAHIRQANPALSAGTVNHVAVAIRKVLSLAYSEGAIPSIPDTPREKRKDNPRAFFRFDPLVSKEKDEYKRLLKEARGMADQKVIVRGTAVTDELRDLIIFLVHSFMRPIISEVFALRHSDIAVGSDPKRLTITVRKGKTGNRITETMEAAVSVYERIEKRNPGYTDDDYLFMPDCKNRAQAQKIFQMQFKELLKRVGLEISHSGGEHSLYSLRHTAICMRLVLSKGKVNIYSLAKNAGTGVDQIERFYAKRLPLTPEMLKNLQSFGEA